MAHRESWLPGQKRETMKVGKDNRQWQRWTWLISLGIAQEEVFEGEAWGQVRVVVEFLVQQTEQQRNFQSRHFNDTLNNTPDEDEPDDCQSIHSLHVRHWPSAMQINNPLHPEGRSLLTSLHRLCQPFAGCINLLRGSTNKPSQVILRRSINIWRVNLDEIQINFAVCSLHCFPPVCKEWLTY